MDSQERYPGETNSQFAERIGLYKAGQKLFSQGKWHAALDHLQMMEQRWPGDGSILLLLGATHAALGQGEAAIPFLRRAALAEPEDELVSRCLFRALWVAGDESGAYEEMERYVFAAGRYSEHYEMVLQEVLREISEAEE